jgi:hypothetical protein
VLAGAGLCLTAVETMKLIGNLVERARYKAALDYAQIMKPLLRAFGSLLMRSDLSFQLCNPSRGCAKLMRKLLRHIDGMPAVLLGNIGGLQIHRRCCEQDVGINRYSSGESEWRW